MLVAARMLFQNRSQGRARIFRININPPCKNRLLADERSRQIKTPFNRQVSSCLDDLREQLSQNELLGEVLRPNHDPVRMPRAAQHWQKTRADEERAKDARSDFEETTHQTDHLHPL